MALAVDNYRFPPDHPDDGGLMPFDSEAQAVEYIVRRLSPFCERLLPELSIGNGLRPDLIAHFDGSQQVPLALRSRSSRRQDASLSLKPSGRPRATRSSLVIPPSLLRSPAVAR